MMIILYGKQQHLSNHFSNDCTTDLTFFNKTNFDFDILEFYKISQSASTFDSISHYVRCMYHAVKHLQLCILHIACTLKDKNELSWA